MVTYEQVLEEIQNRYELGIITEAQAERYLDLLEDRCYANYIDESVNKIENDYMNGLISESEDIENITLLESAWDDWLKDHDYDPKTKTVKINGGRVKIDRENGNSFKTNYKANKFVSSYDRNDKRNKDLRKKGLSGRFDARMGRGIKSSLDAAKYGGLKIAKIDAPDDKMSKTSHDDIDRIMNHEYGHVKDISYARKVNREPDFFKKYNSSVVPKELRAEYIAMKKKIKDVGGEKKLSNKDKANFYLLKKKIKEKSEVYKKDKDAQFADKYKEFDNKTKRHIGLHNRKGHASSPGEIKADIYAKRHSNNTSYSDQKKLLDKVSSLSKDEYKKLVKTDMHKKMFLQAFNEPDPEKQRIKYRDMIKKDEMMDSMMDSNVGDKVLGVANKIDYHHNKAANKKRMKDNKKMDKKKSSSYLNEMVDNYLSHTDSVAEAVAEIKNDYLNDIISYYEYADLIEYVNTILD